MVLWKGANEMANWIIIGLLIIVVIIAISSGAKHFRGEGGCCGGGSDVKVKRKKLKNVVKQRTVIVEGMLSDKVFP